MIHGISRMNQLSYDQETYTTFVYLHHYGKIELWDYRPWGEFFIGIAGYYGDILWLYRLKIFMVSCTLTSSYYTYNDLVSLSRLRLNTIQTYVPWNFHELDFEGNVIDFNGERNLLLFLDLAAKYNMFVLLRPGPCTWHQNKLFYLFIYLFIFLGGGMPCIHLYNILT